MTETGQGVGTAGGVDAGTKYCRDCGSEIREEAEICPECGIRQEGNTVSVDTDSLTDQYSTVTWVAAVIVGLLTLPLGLAIPGYFYVKASKGTGAEQGGWEVWTVILLGIIGIIAVEVGGEKGAKVLWALVAALILLFIFAIALAI